MKHKGISLLVLLIGFGVIPAFAEVGSNFDREQIGDNTFKWTSHYERIWDGNQWANYLWSDNGNIIHFESANLSYELDKNTCSFKLEGLDGYEKSLSIDGSPVSLSNCKVTNINENENTLQIIITEDAPETELKTIFDLRASGTEEWTYEISNKNLIFNKQYSIEETCLNCTVLKTDGDLIYLDDYILDTKNREHNTLKRIDESKDLKLGYDYAPIGFFETAIIDPIFTTNNPTFDGELQDADNDNNCEASPGSFNWLPTQTQVGKYTNGAAFDCGRVIVEFDVSSISTITVLDSDLSFQNNAGTNPVNCDYVVLAARPKTASNATNWAGVDTGTVLVNNDATCTAAGNNKNVDLSVTGDAYIQTQIDTLGWVGIGIKTDTDLGVLDASNHISVFCPEESACTPDFTLTITYHYDSIQIDSVDLTNIGDIAKIDGIVTSDSTQFLNLTAIKLFVNGTLTNTNSTGQNTTNGYTVTYGPIWYQMLTDDVYNFTIWVDAQTELYNNITNSSSSLLTREYDPDYFIAEVPAQGDVNYTMIDNVFKINRDKGGATFQIECFIQDWADVFFDSGGGTWYNQTVIGAYTQELLADSDHYTTCYNDDLLFSAPLPANYSNYLLPGLVIFDQLGGLMGAPSALLMVLAIYSLATGRNFPIISVIAMSVIGIMGALGLLVFDGAIWGLLMVLTGICLFGVRKFF